MEIELNGGATADLFAVVGAKRGVVLVPDVLGRRSLFRKLAAGLASDHGWNVMVVDVFGSGRESTPALVGSVPKVEAVGAPGSSLNGSNVGTSLSTASAELNSQVAALDDDVVVSDLVDAADRLEVDPVAIIGFCLGGTYVYKAAASHRFDRLVSFGGKIRLPRPWQGPNQREPLQLLEHVDDCSQILSIVGLADSDISDEDATALRNLGVQVECFEGADQGFALGATDTYRPQDSAVAWSRTYEHINKR